MKWKSKKEELVKKGELPADPEEYIKFFTKMASKANTMFEEEDFKKLEEGEQLIVKDEEIEKEGDQIIKHRLRKILSPKEFAELDKEESAALT